VRSTIDTRNSYGSPTVVIVGSVVYANETLTPLPEDGEDPGEGRFVAFDLDSGKELWTLDEPRALYVTVTPDGLLVVTGDDDRGEELTLLS